MSSAKEQADVLRSGPIDAETLVQLLTAANLSASDREQAAESHRQGGEATLTREADFTYTLGFANGDSCRLSYQQGEALAALFGK